MENNYYPFVNHPLLYAYNALEPYIDKKTMYLHHTRHLQTYIDNLNGILEKNPRLQKYSLEQLIYNSSRFSKELQDPIKNNSGGVYNHRFFFDSLSNRDKKFPSGDLAEAIDRAFGDFESFKEKFKAAALSVFGSGYAWLVLDREKLKIITTANQDSPIQNGLCPILTLDVWEHAYYLKHYNLRSDYINDWFNVINWNKAEENYSSCITNKHIIF